MTEMHLDATLGWLRDPVLRQQVDSLDEPTAAGNRLYWQARWADPREESYAIVDLTGRHVGNCGFRQIDYRRRKAELWIYLAERRGAGLGTAAVEALLARAFSELGLNRVYLRVRSDNPSAERFYRRLGFVFEGRWREDTWSDGAPVDSLWFALLGSDRYATIARLHGTTGATSRARSQAGGTGSQRAPR